ncbi:alpha/beta hydrolase family esterase [Flavimaricola marinus]|nr:PHB depolymerase family esterase [Flavimaricola marinus]
MTKIRSCAVVLLALGLIATSIPDAAQAQTLRERIQARAAERQAARAAGGSNVSGAESVTITVGGINRQFLVHVPANVAPRPGAVLVFHGGRGTAEGIMETSGMNVASDQGGFLAVYPQAAAEGSRWVSGSGVAAGGPDDVAFVRAMIDTLEQRYNVDPGRVFGTGISSGGVMLHGMACQAPGVLRAIAPVAAHLTEDVRAGCAPSQGTPIMMFSGTADPLMVYNGGQATLAIARNSAPEGASDPVVSAPDTIAFWAARNGCGGASSSELRDASNDGTTVTQISYSCGANRTYLFRVNGGGHAWPGSGTSRRISGPTSQDISATATMVQFFRDYGL